MSDVALLGVRINGGGATRLADFSSAIDVMDGGAGSLPALASVAFAGGCCARRVAIAALTEVSLRRKREKNVSSGGFGIPAGP